MPDPRSTSFPLRRREVVAKLLADRGDLLVVSGLGAPSWDATAAGDSPQTFPLWGAMGGALPTGLGLAVARPDRRVLIITGDGEILMGLGSFATIAAQGPENLAVAVLDNESYGETGMQQTHTAHGVDLPGMAAAAGWPVTGTVATDVEFEESLPLLREAKGPVLIDIKVRAEDLPLVLPPNDGVVLKERFRTALLGHP